ncbi:SufS family cysteine desulfurase [Candidatus Liberibacter sp.]|uniref:SufS family cysteine desulfurase n=1 Tax=Candidatus Liberibacter sp. TaxID=34022 RepID=UPI0015F44F7E|nr:SufS family cysteine desulfurase [Candidatus Liberibacter sp.]MBA5723860.1 SufS family cysteine desulfurase [Candidatus Liberibacter sp.]
MIFDVETVRKDFPILSRSVHKNPLIYLDNAASAQKPKVVIDSAVHTYSHEYANVHRGLHFMSNAVTESYENARAKVCRFMKASSPQEIIFTRSSTEAINAVAYGWGMSHVHQDDEIVLSIMEHHSNVIPWHFLRQNCGARLVWIPIDQQGRLQIDEFEKCLTARTKLVAITHMSQVLGTNVPIKDICRIAHERNIPVLVDGSQGAVHLPLDVQNLDCDWYVMTSHKLYGPSGIGVLYGKRDRLDAMEPFMGGGGMVSEVTKDKVSYADLPHRFEAGTPPIVQAIGFGMALDYMESLNREAIFAYEGEIARYTMSHLKEIDGLRLFSVSSDDSPIISFRLRDIHPYDLSVFLDGEGIAIRSGTHCASPLLDFLGVDYLCRASFAMYNTREESDKFIEVLKRAVRFFA